jgi:hypothetical protein
MKILMAVGDDTEPHYLRLFFLAQQVHRHFNIDVSIFALIFRRISKAVDVAVVSIAHALLDDYDDAVSRLA